MPDFTSQAWRPKRAAVIGIGLLGGSVGLALRRAWPDIYVVGVARNQETLNEALSAGAATEVSTDPSQACTGCDLVVVATPVDLVADCVREVAASCGPDTLITDVGSTKAGIVTEVYKSPELASRFIGSHPIAGGDKSGPSFARADLFDDRVVVVTPTSLTDATLVQRTVDLWRTLGAKVEIVSPEDHDRLLAATSHVPHLVAAGLASVLPEGADAFAGPGWRDTTRVAAGSPQMWAAIFLENQRDVLSELDRFEESIALIRQAIMTGDRVRVESMLCCGRDVRLRIEASGSSAIVD